MSDRLSHLESRVEELTRALAAVEHRLGRLESGQAPRAELAGPARAAAALPETRPESLPETLPEAPSEPLPAPESPPGLEVPELDLVRVVSLFGRTLMVLGGAYLLRAVTDAGVLPRPVGIASGLAFALLWVFLADRAGSERPRSANFHGVAAVLVAFPLLWETAVRFQAVSVVTAVAGLAGVAVLVLAVSWRRNLPGLAWVATLGGVATGWAFILTAQAWVPAGLLLIFLAAAALLMAQLRGGWSLAWVGGLLTDATVLLLTFGVLTSTFDVAAPAAAAVQLTLAAVFLALTAAGYLLQRRAARSWEMVQTGAVLAVGLWGGARVLDTLPAPTALVFAGCALALAAAGYTGGMLYIRAGSEAWRRRNFFHMTAVALAAALLAMPRLLPVLGLTLVASAAAVAAAVASQRFGGRTLALHSAVYLTAAAVWSGLLTSGAYALAFPATASWPPPPALGAVVLVAAAVASWWVGGRDSGRVVALLPLAILAWGLGGLVMRGLAPILAGAPGPAADAGVLATLRTGVLAAASVLLAVVGRGRLREAAWLAYGVLVVGGMKLLLEDFPNGRPATLFLGLALYGGALVAVARLARRRSHPRSR